ncbi:riboflavin synthase [Pseudoclavibacter sp. RFBJ3]|uniref:riboflavin synthase n=1 Tax=unclassified Pseudoclavibacter TaxID=2615177 RepID=UPI000CE7E3E8|nr:MULTISPECIES: riboflavin synthase [unclassified Pseudoclavibacter]PPF82714.1 riboflavin synthase [Pseudoclavibacter sp. RFBJ5]PPF91608.1 riboflavin synthase [Pseudoclavibacter sp. RFBJ3]PPF96504.1 riboflavin synthase [Pseudoclavibacter sp. RFBH5]PPG22278.1 riboflavin synthase [Pseudoclavibacter sp. RFBI4]
MFTGIIEELGRISSIERHDTDARLTLRAPLSVSDARIGDSISVDGVCLTVAELLDDGFTADVMGETLRASALGDRAEGDPVNLERAMRLGDRLGGHIVQGHIDTTSEVLEVERFDAWRRIRFAIDPAHARLLVDKGSVAVSGVSLTVSAVSAVSAVNGVGRAGADGSPWFEVSLIPETLAATTLGDLGVGDRVNVETDILARHVARLASHQA